MASRRQPFTEAQQRIIDGARRRVTRIEKILSRGRFAPGGEYFVEASVTKITPTTPFLTVSRVRDYLAGMSHSTATALRKAGLLPYTSAATEAQAEKQAATKATLTSKLERIKKAKREARRKRASSEAGITAGRNQRVRTIRYINEGFAKHERYLKTGQGRLNDDEYRKIVHLMYEYGYDEDRLERMKDSYTVSAMAA